MEEYNKFERARLVGARALQLSMGAPALIKVNKKEDTYIDIAKRELEKDILPITVKKDRNK
ncbi:MAG: DNA-directed RNA polymerase subunit K [Candidatus Parvarchaeota archaeon]|jgi:DNA-directed RNA polymerase subunit K|uniref:DNA-directed RNA polymerase subunit Rpo6 n=1 Tax=Candidatus Parvarchaeum acidiphilum ARMAN-4_'5-way FS' TaxID=994837 RepID=F2UTS4_PARA4|nr:MAG: RNA polymerase Rpb6 [Candidatus Parvarchaeum acidiphilum ARMAN-4_'5-way FS']MCL5976400.1 DNA-directed RNA polymerase subunit K [Candidatus Parvarchaeota archaeon]